MTRWAFIAALTLTACGGSPPLHYHTLKAADEAGSSQQQARMLVDILPITIPERLDRSEIVTVSANGAIEVHDTERWASPLPAEIRHVLVETLWQRLAAVDVYQAALTGSADVPHLSLSLRIERFDAMRGQDAVMEASWTVRQLPTGRGVACHIHLTSPLAETDTDSAVAALSAATQKLGGLVAASLAARGRG